MKPFHTIAIPHEDILNGRLTMDVFAADLWEVNKTRGVDEYKDADTFFKKTYLTQGLNNLLNIVKKRIDGKGGDPIIQIQTPFGDLKRNRSFKRFYLRGLAKVEHEFGLHCIAHNLRKINRIEMKKAA